MGQVHDLVLFDDQTLARDEYHRFRRTDPMTSRTAISDGWADKHERDAYRILVEYGPVTADEISALLPNSYKPSIVSAISRLHRKELAFPTGKTRASAGDGR